MLTRQFEKTVPSNRVFYLALDNQAKPAWKRFKTKLKISHMGRSAQIFLGNNVIPLSCALRREGIPEADDYNERWQQKILESYVYRD